MPDNTSQPNGVKLQEHINAETKEEIDALKEHAQIANSEMGIIKQSIGIIQADMQWLKKFFWIVATASIGGLITGLINLMLKAT